VGGNGAIINSSGVAQQNALRVVNLVGNTTFGGTGRWDIRGVGAALSTFGGGYNITKVGDNEIWLVDVAVEGGAGGLGNVTVQSGVLGYEAGTAGLGDPALTLTIATGAGLGFFNSTVPVEKVVVLNGSGTNNTVDARSGLANTILGPVTLNGSCIFNHGAADDNLTLSGAVGGAGSLTKTGGSLLHLNGTAAFSGNTTISGGTLALSAGAELANSPVITIGDGAVLDVTGLTAGPALALNSGQTLAGNGSVNGALNALASSTVAPGLSVGALTVTNDVTLQGTTRMELDGAAGTNDLLRSATGSITYGGTLNLVSVSPLPGGSSYKLFNAASYLGSFASLDPATPGPGQTWDTSTLNTDGTLRVIGNPVGSTRPVVVSTVQIGTDLVVSGTNGTASGQYYVLEGTNITQPLATWERVATNNFVNGNFSFTNTVNTSLPQRFYLLQLP
jgi:autotransporter-associated beta strand protein